MHNSIKKNPQKLVEYHNQLDVIRSRWEIDPVNVITDKINNLRIPANVIMKLVIGDFGCGRCRLADLLKENKVHCFDHNNILDKRITACNMKHTGLKANSLGIAVFSLSLMSVDWRENDIGTGTVTGIIQEARKQEGYQDIDLLRQVSLKLKEEGLELPELGFAIRLKRIREENGINEDQIESIIQDFAAYCLRHSISIDAIIKVGREALYLEEKFGVPIEKIPEYIIEAKKTIDNLEDERQEILRQKQQAREDRDMILQQCDEMRRQRDAIVAELEKYGKEIPSIRRIKELEMELDEAKKLNENYETHIIRLEKKLNNAELEAMRSVGDRIEADARCKTYERQLSLILDKLEKLEKKNVALRQCLKMFFILIILLTIELSLITEYKRSQQYLS